jgi:hypothetical protein
MTEQECVEKVSQAMRDAYKHSKGKTTDSTTTSNTTGIRVERVSQKSSKTTAAHKRRSSEHTPIWNPLFDRTRQAASFRDDSVTPHFLQQQLLRNSFSDIDRDSSSYTHMEVSSASLPNHSLHNNPHIEDFEPAYSDLDIRVKRMLSDSQGMSLTGLHKGMLSINLDNTTAHWENPPSYDNFGRISRIIQPNTAELDSKKPAVDFSSQQRQHLERQKKTPGQNIGPPEKSSKEKEHDSFDDAINEILGPLQNDDVENAFKVD